MDCYGVIKFGQKSGRYGRKRAVAGVSQPSFNVAREIRISQEPQSYSVLFG